MKKLTLSFILSFLLFMFVASFDASAAFTHKPGDILVTKSTQCKSGVKCTGLTGHSGIVLENGKVLHIAGPGYHPTQISTSTWYDRYSSTKVVRPNSSTEGKKAATWAYNFYVTGEGKNYEYDIRTTLNGKDGKTYCSKLVWQAYKNGAGKSLATYTPGFIAPYDFFGYTWINGHDTVRTVNW